MIYYIKFICIKCKKSAFISEIFQFDRKKNIYISALIFNYNYSYFNFKNKYYNVTSVDKNKSKYTQCGSLSSLYFEKKIIRLHDFQGNTILLLRYFINLF